MAVWSDVFQSGRASIGQGGRKDASVWFGTAGFPTGVRPFDGLVALFGEIPAAQGLNIGLGRDFGPSVFFESGIVRRLPSQKRFFVAWE